MTARIEGVTFDSGDPARAAAFWAEALGWRIATSDADSASLIDPSGVGTPFGFTRVPEPKLAKNRMHFDLGTDLSVDAEAARLLGLGATKGERHEEGGYAWVVMHDPDGNEFCVGAAAAMASDAQSGL